MISTFPVLILGGEEGPVLASSKGYIKKSFNVQYFGHSAQSTSELID